jgi:ESF2/ABP1 family protein
MAKSSKAGPPRRRHTADSDDNKAGPSGIRNSSPDAQDAFSDSNNGSDNGGEDRTESHSADSGVDVEDGDADDFEDSPEGFGDGMDLEGFSGPKEKVVKPLTPEALAAFRAAKEKNGVVYISRIPPGMRPTKVRHLMSQYGEIGKVYLQQEGVHVYSSERARIDSVPLLV